MKIVNLLFLLFFCSQSAASGSTVGNGGDPLLDFLEATRKKFKETILDYDNKDFIDEFCNKVDEATDDETHFCHIFMQEVKEQLVQLNVGKLKTPFSLSKIPLEVLGPNNKPMQVAAKTQLGPEGVIEFYYDAIRLSSPEYVFNLMAHEFGHKVKFNQNYIDDLSPIGPFNTGREFLGFMSQTLTKLAKERGRIGQHFGIKDRFSCYTTHGSSHISRRSMYTVDRIYYNKQYSHYETGLGPKFGNIIDSNFNPKDRSSIEFRFRIQEKNQCNTTDPSGRKTTMEIYHVFQEDIDGNTPEPILLNHKEILENPLCESESTAMTLGIPGLQFSCTYIGSLGTSYGQMSFDNF